MKAVLLVSLGVSCAGFLPAQSNVVPGLDGRLEILDNITYWGRRGAAHPGGEVGLSMRNTMCNPGSVNIPWYAVPQENHPFFGFLITRLSGDRMVQISDWSYCKHAFTSASQAGACGNCVPYVGGNQMGPTCSDTYSAGHNAGRDDLGPPWEINPWLGTWTMQGSYFDQGDPNVGPPNNNDGQRSPILPGGDPVKNRVTVKESDLLVAGAQYFYAIHLIHRGEALANRHDNLKSRGFTPSWNGSTWTVMNSGPGETFGSVLQHWPGADLQWASNGLDDGRFYVACKVTPLGGGNFHYEYAVHNVDNSRAGAAFRVPIDAAAVASNFSFRDIDQNPLNDWTAARVGNEIVFSAPANNPHEWNTIYNFGFDANFPPGSSAVQIDAARPGPGALYVTVGAKAPSSATYAQATPVGAGCGGYTCPESVYEYFATASSFDLANSQWALLFNGTSYTLSPSTASWAPAAGSALPSGDDVGANYALPFTLPYPGGSTNNLWVCSNGFVSVSGSNTSYTPSVAAFLAGVPTWAAAWHDFNPAAGSIRIETTPTVVRVTYSAVANYAGGGNATFQYQFYPSGDVHVLYQAVTAAGNPYLVGFTRGNGAANPGGIDWSASLNQGITVCAGPVPNVVLAANARPVLGTTIGLVTSNIPGSALLGLSILSLTQHNPGIDLGFLGMSGCTLYAGLDVVNSFLITGSTATVPWSIPNLPSASGLVVVNQSALWSPPSNAFGFLTSNGVLLLLGVN
jgi:hypothetical protein